MFTDLDINNVYIYIADAVRWDFAPDEVVNRGKTIKTVASGIHSPTSIASIVSGTLLPQHNVGQFEDSLPDAVPNIFHDLDIETSFANTINNVRFDTTQSESIIANTLNIETVPPDQLDEIPEPFLFVERGPGGHAPYGRKQDRENATEYFKQRSDATRDQFAREYRESVSEDAEWFLDRVESLRERGILSDTLVIYTSDHGELLGEDGMVAHSPPIHPRHVYVPTIFIHSDLETEIKQDSTLRHVDLLPTISTLLGESIGTSSRLAGRDLTNKQLATVGSCFYSASRRTKARTVKIAYDSVWDPTGGYVYCDTSRLSRVLLGLHQSVRTPWRQYIRDHLSAYAPFLLRGDQCHWAPELSQTEAEQYLENVRTESTDHSSSETQDVAAERLRELGYIK